MPVYLIASDQMQKKSLQTSDISSPKLVEKPQKPVSAPSILNDSDKKIFETIKDFRNNIPTNIKKELEAFNGEKKKLNEAKKKLYDELSKEAKQIMSKEKSLRRKLSPDGIRAVREISKAD